MIGNVEISSKDKYYRIVGNIEWKPYDNLDNLKKEFINDIEQDLSISKELCKVAFHALDEKQGVDIKVLDIHEVSILADYFIIAHGNNPNHVQAMIDEVEDQLAKAGYSEVNIEGYGDG